MNRNNETKEKRVVNISEDDRELFELQANVCLALGNPKRLMILNLLKNGEMAAGEIVDAMEISKANVSQHLSVLRNQGIVVARREGTTIYYRLSHPMITEACSIMRDVLRESLKVRERLAALMHEDEQ